MLCPEPAEHADPGWGPGVSDPAALHSKLEAVVAYADPDRGVYLEEQDVAHVVGMASVMTWEQAASVYRDASINLKRIMCHRLIPGDQTRYRGMTRRQVVELLGKPDGDDTGEHGTALIYTGEGRASDSTSGIIFNFDEGGEFWYIGYAN